MIFFIWTIIVGRPRFWWVFNFCESNCSMLFINVQWTYGVNFGLKIVAESILCSKKSLTTIVVWVYIYIYNIYAFITQSIYQIYLLSGAIYMVSYMFSIVKFLGKHHSMHLIYYYTISDIVIRNILLSDEKLYQFSQPLP